MLTWLYSFSLSILTLCYLEIPKLNANINSTKCVIYCSLLCQIHSNANVLTIFCLLYFHFTEDLEETTGTVPNTPSPQNIHRTHSGKVRIVKSHSSTPTDAGAALRVPGVSRSSSRSGLSRAQFDTVSNTSCREKRLL